MGSWKQLWLTGLALLICALGPVHARADWFSHWDRDCKSSFQPKPFSQYSYWVPRWPSVKACLWPREAESYYSDRFANIPTTYRNLPFPCPAVDPKDLYSSPYNR